MSNFKSTLDLLKNFKHRNFSECPIFWGRNEKKKNIYNFPKQAKISKIAKKKFPSILE